jgi:cyclopropane fatty-acyl-phospholipid synthase-like methyltransferase
MELSFAEIFKYSDILNPVSARTLLLAGKIARMQPKSTILDLGSGKGYPSLLWSSTFGVRVEGFDTSNSFVEYANSRAKMLNLSHKAKYYCKNVRELRLYKKYSMVASLGLGTAQAYGTVSDALKTLKTMLQKNGILILAEPVWLSKPVAPEVLKAIGESEDSLLTETEMQQLMEKSGFQVIERFVSSKEDWELYVGPVYTAMQEITASKSELASEAKKVVKGFKAECDAVGRYWNMLLWVAKTH